MPAPPNKADLFPLGNLSGDDAKVYFEQFFDYVVALLGASGDASAALAALGAAADSAVVKLSGSQTIGGVKTFSTAPTVPVGTNSGHTVNLSQLQSATRAASESVAGVIEIATNAEAQGFVANKAIDGAKLAQAFKGSNQSLSASALRQTFPGDLQIKAGESINTAGGYGVVSVTFANAFPNACVFAGPVYENASGANLFAPVVQSRSAAGFSAYCALINLRWFAIGY